MAVFHKNIKNEVFSTFEVYGLVHLPHSSTQEPLLTKYIKI